MEEGPMNPQPSLVLVTGAGHRLGKAIALGAARHGYAVGLHYNRSAEKAQLTAEEIQAMGAPVYLLQANLTVPREIESMFARVADLPQRLGVLVNSAAVMPHGNLRDISAEEWDATLALNLRAPLLCAQAAARIMGEAGGLIVNVSDAGAQKTWTGFPAYTVSKAAVETLTRLLARALAPGIRVNAVAPGLILPAANLPQEEWQRLVDRIPLKRAGLPEEVADAVLFLIQNQYITGQILAVDGGYRVI